MKNNSLQCLYLILFFFSTSAVFFAQDKGQIAFKINEPDLIPEGIAHDSKTKDFYVGSTYKRKIVRIDKNGKVSDFTAEAQDGLRSVLGMRVDAKRRILWAVSEHAGGTVPFKGMTKDCLGCSDVFKYDLKTGKLLKKYSLSNQPNPHFLNDLTINKQGDVFLTDTITGEIYFISYKNDKLEPIHTFEKNTYPNGVDLSSDGKRLFVGLEGNIAVINLENKKSFNLKMPDGVKVGSIDGLYFHRNSLIVVHPFEEGRKIVRYYLNENQDAVTRTETIEANHKLFLQPTTGAIVENNFYYIANSQLQLFRGMFKPDGSFDRSKLSNVLILKIAL